MDTHVLQTFSLTKRFNQLTAVDQVDLSVQKGSIFGFLGPNGAGKTTTIRMILGLVRPTEGKTMWFGRPLTDTSMDLLKKVGTLIETPSYYPHLTGRENLEVLRRLTDGNKADILRVLKIVGLEKDANRVVKHYSLGMCQRLGLGMALLNHPQVLVLDEPINGLDPAGIHEMRELFLALREEGVTLFISSHLLSEIEQIATEIGIIRHGSLIFQGSPLELRTHFPRHIKIGVDKPKEAATWLREKGLNVYESTNQHINLSIHNNQEISEITRGLMMSGINLHECHCEEFSLEDIFLQVTSEEKQNKELK